jgi:hypothetical protein
MALYGQARDISMFRYVNRELMGNIISQQAAFYKLRLSQTNFNMYGEAAEAKFYDGPILLYTLIDLPDQSQPVDELGVTFDWKPTFRFLRDDLLDKLQDYNKDTIFLAVVPRSSLRLLQFLQSMFPHATPEHQFLHSKLDHCPNHEDNCCVPVSCVTW